MAASDTKRERTDRRLARLRPIIWPDHPEDAWPGCKESLCFRAPSILPIVLRILDSKGLRGDRDVSRTYLDLMAREQGGGVVELDQERDHAYLAGFEANERGVKSWRERIRILADLGFIRVAPRGSSPYGYVLLLDPERSILSLRERGLISDGDWNLFHSLRLTHSEP